MKFNSYPATKPPEGKAIFWVWAQAGKICIGDLWNNRQRDAGGLDALCGNLSPTHWVEFPKNWPK